GCIEAGSMTFTGSATGKRFLIESGGKIITGVESLTYFPGDVAGTISGGYLDNRTSVPVTLTPTYGGVTTAGSTTYGSPRTGEYRQEGSRIDFTLQVTWTANSGGAGQAFVGGLPVAAATTTSVPIGYADNVTVGAGKQLVGVIISGETRVRLYAVDPTGAAAAVAVEAAGEVYISGSYYGSGLF
ncbi:MAG: hypothetical protein ACKVZJ_10855, partial [Phycisphaerales bacterium]